MSGQPQRLRAVGYEPVVVSSASTELDGRAIAEGAGRIVIPICRDISLLHDALTFLALCWVFFRERPVAVILSGPKAIFLGGIVAWLMGVERRIAVYHGMRQETLRGPLLWILNLCDRIAFATAHIVLAVSSSLRARVISRRLCSPDKIRITGNGTANGIDCAHYDATAEVKARAALLGAELQLPVDVPVIGFVGRITEDKGLAQLLEIHAHVSIVFPRVILMLVGNEEVHTSAGAVLLDRAKSNRNIRCTGPVADVRPYLHRMKVLIFPSLREGFPIAPMEAAAMGVPTVAFPSTGVVDAVVHGQTGMLCPAGDVVAMANATVDYLQDDRRRLAHGLSARQRILADFSPDVIWHAYAAALVDAGS